ncbi:WD40 domain-containing protein [Microdochium trichocladiopsis]|uniref:WD40 domain-containing protein n=1 Tax=Microdochium trichocladiopsis TaxID=1682393 RepID=A0A9P8YES9_9PEZI|nr:WD40 domain-containing protein [Microdochium trichocladiopsis]KAH7037671.1 WD40 domain-containing protein [Microdochium trichocladiopsis]
MLYSRVLKGSPHCLPSPDGNSIAALLASAIAIREVQTLQVTNTIKLPAGLSGGVVAFSWAPSATRILVAVVDQVHVFSTIPGDSYHAVIRLATSSVAKPTLVTFGAADDEVLVFSTHGIKLSIFNLSSSTTIEIANPKFYTAPAAARGHCIRPKSNHLALLTRNAGKDMISIHPPRSRELMRSWTVETIDAQGLTWTPDGNWLLVWESAAHGHRLLYYTPDGHLFNEWHGPKPGPGDVDLHLGAGIGHLKLGAVGELIAISDSSRAVTVLSTSTMAEKARLTHTDDIRPSETLQVWQEQSVTQTEQAGPIFAKATQTVAPPGGSVSGSSDAKSGCNLIAFDCSCTLLVTRLAAAPSTLWIWDIPNAELRAVLVYHSDVVQVQWHPTQAELLLIRCEAAALGTIFVWDPLSQGPRTLGIESRLKLRKITGKLQVRWLDRADELASVFYADDSSFGLCLLADNDSDLAEWFPQGQEDQDSFLSLAGSDRRNGTASLLEDFDDDHSDMEDTFHFKRT